MVSKIFVFGLLALFACQVSCNVIDVDGRDLIGSIAAVLAKLTIAVTKAIDVGVAKLNDVINIVITQAQKQLEKAAGIMQNVVTKALTDINKLIAQAGGVGVDVSECIGTNIDEIKDLPVETLKELNACINQNLLRANEIHEETVIELDNFKDTMKGFEKEIEACADSKEASCYLKVYKDIVVALAKVPWNITKVVLHGTKTLLDVGKDIGFCQADYILKISTSVAAASSETIGCIKAKLHSAAKPVFLM